MNTWEIQLEKHEHSQAAAEQSVGSLGVPGHHSGHRVTQPTLSPCQAWGSEPSPPQPFHRPWRGRYILFP